MSGDLGPTGPPTLRQATLGMVCWLALAALPAWWATDESDLGNRLFLWGLAVVALFFAGTRVVWVVRRAAERRRP